MITKREWQRRQRRQDLATAAAILFGLLLIGYFWLMWAIYGELP